jgi:hypothetical protein
MKHLTYLAIVLQLHHPTLHSTGSKLFHHIAEIDQNKQNHSVKAIPEPRLLMWIAARLHGSTNFRTCLELAPTW